MNTMSEKNESIFRKKALDQIRSPEQLNDYLKVTNPSVWVILVAAVLLFAGLFVWSSIGKLETIAPAIAVVENGNAKITLTGMNAVPITSDMKARIDDTEYDISIVERDEYGRSIAIAPVALQNGTYDAKVVLETVSPISFLIN